MASQMQIKVANVEIGSGTTKTNKPYEYLDLMYKNLSFDNKAESKKIMPFGAKEVFATLKNAQPGDVFTILREKDDAGYWQWVGISEGTDPIQQAPTQRGADPVATKPTTQPAKSTFETPEERAKKQVYIIRQSSLSTAVDLLKTDKKAPSVDEVIHVAKIFEDYVFGINLDADPVAKLPEIEEDDIPM